MAMESSRSLVALGPRIPEMLGNFHLDDHNVEEWSDATGPGVRHKARKEMGKWINPDSNADIQYQKHEDCKQSDRSKEQSRTEVIQGQAPDSTFQIVHSHKQFQDVDDSKNSRVQTSSTSYQMSSSRGVRSTSKSTSNRTTTKTVTVSGGRTDDFENLKMSFQPLDTSTQRERINVSRSGTMGVRRPPTRRHTPAAALSSSPEDDNIDTRDEIIVDSDDNMRSTPEFDNTRLSEQTGLSIVGFKNISPKIRVGFPMEIQLELQTKLRGSANRSRCNDEDIASFAKSSNGNNSSYLPSTTIMQETRQDIEELERIVDDAANPLFELSANNEDSTFDFKQRRKSYGFDSFDSHTKQSERSSDHNTEATSTKTTATTTSTSHHDILPMSNSTNPITFYHPIITDRLEQISGLNSALDTDDNSQKRSSTHYSRLSPSSISRSWDLIQSAHTAQQRREANKKLFNTSSDSQQSHDTNNEREVTTGNYSQRNSSQKTVVTLNASEELNSLRSTRSRDIHPLNSLESISSSQISHSTKRSTVAKQDETDSQVGCTPDVLHHDPDDSTLSPSLERSRKLLKLLDETPDILHKMSYKNYFTDGLKLEDRHWDDKEGPDWETQRQLSFLNDSLSRILDDGRSNQGVNNNDKTGSMRNDYVNDEETNRMEFSSSRRDEFDDSEVDFNGNVKNRISQISQTWISSGDPQKPSQKVRDNDVTTSISATNDPFKKGPKKVEFCKTEVHFTADSGKFHIVETDENKPSTSHLFRKKKKGDKGKQSSLASSSSSTPTVQEKLSSIKSDLEIGINQTEVVDQKETISHHDSKKEHKQGVLLVEMEEEDRELKNDVGAVEALLFQHRSSKEGKSEQDERINRGVPPPPPTTSITSTAHSLAMKNTPVVTSSYARKDSSGSGGSSSVSKSLPLLSLHRENLANEGEEVFEKSHIVMSLDEDGGGEEDTQSPSHMILSNYGEMKIQRYLKQLKSPSSQNGSESPTELFDLVPDHDHPSHFRFDNVLYENGSFVPLATRRSLIEMNNRNRKRNTTSQTSGNSSTMSNYSLPNSDKDNSAPASSSYQPLRLARMEAKVTTARPKPQITSVELRYELENERPYNPEPIVNRQLHLNLRQQTEKENRTYVPAPVMPPELKSVPAQRNGRYSYSSVSPDESRSGHEMLRNAKPPPTPVLPAVNYTNFEKGAAIRDRFYYKNSTCGCDDSEKDEVSSNHRMNDVTMSASSVTSKSQSKGTSKSIVTIGDYDVGRSSRHERISKTEDYVDESEQLSPEPVLSMDHTWKGPAHFENENATNKTVPVVRSLTFPKSNRSEPEWVSKARSRESRMTDWDLIGKQSGVETPPKSEPPWMDEIIRFRSKSSAAEEVKTLPKISVVYPWQRDTESAGSKPLEEDKAPEVEEIEEESHIVSIVPAPPMLSYRKESGEGSRYVKSLAILESPKSVPLNLTVLEVSKRDIVDRDSDTILINATQILKKDESSESRGRNRLKFQGQEKSDVSSTLISKKHVSSKSAEFSTVKSNQFEESSSPNLISAKTRSKSASKEQQTQNTKTETSMTKTVKNPKPPQRISSLTKAETESSQPSLKSFKSINTNTLENPKNKTTSSLIRTTGPLAQKQKEVKKGTVKKSDVEESSGSSRSNTPIHRHPMVKVSKLPIRKNVPSKGAESKPVSTAFGSRVKNKDKHQVAVNSETKQSQSGKSVVMEGTGCRSRDSSSAKTQSTSDRRNVDQKYLPKGSSSNRKK